jgi:hypothetical protein
MDNAGLWRIWRGAPANRPGRRASPDLVVYFLKASHIRAKLKASYISCSRPHTSEGAVAIAQETHTHTHTHTHKQRLVCAGCFHLHFITISIFPYYNTRAIPRTSSCDSSAIYLPTQYNSLALARSLSLSLSLSHTHTQKVHANSNTRMTFLHQSPISRRGI